ncbi:MAG: hypothetical protein ACW97A_11145 [Candidatus Thorarchaeota archaeon]|jgi:hypothetical protein
MLFGILIVAAILIPNFLWMAFPPTTVSKHEEFFEPEINGVFEVVALMMMVLSLVIYYGGWTRYFIRGREYELLFQSLWKIPLPMAVAPIIYFFGAVVILHSLVLLVAVILLALGHLYISHYDSK